MIPANMKAIVIKSLLILTIITTFTLSAEAHRKPHRHKAYPLKEQTLHRHKHCDYRHKATSPRQRLSLALEHIRRYGKISPKEYARLTGMSRRDAKRELRYLSQESHSPLRALGKGRRVYYVM